MFSRFTTCNVTKNPSLLFYRDPFFYFKNLKPIHFSGSFVIVWKRGITLLTAGQQKITADPRISLLGYNLEVRDIRYTDQGDYTCQIGDGSHGDLIHTVEILSKSPFIFKLSGFYFFMRQLALTAFWSLPSNQTLQVRVRFIRFRI